jgi:hypothetical protein
VAAGSRLAHIVNEVVGPNPPHVFIILEVTAKATDEVTPGGILRGSKPAGRGVAGRPATPRQRGGAKPEPPVASAWRLCKRVAIGGTVRVLRRPHRLGWPDGGARAPFRTRFLEVAAGGLRRVLNIYSVHTSPATATNAVDKLTMIPGLAPGVGEATLVIGDFNVDTGTPADLEWYEGLETVGMEMLIDPRVPGLGPNRAINPARVPRCQTHLLSNARATPYCTGPPPPPFPQQGDYPRFGYMGTGIPGGGLSGASAIDNAFVCYGNGTGRPVGAPYASIVNTVVGKPYGPQTPPLAGLDNGYQYPQTWWWGWSPPRRGSSRPPSRAWAPQPSPAWPLPTRPTS